MVFGQRELSRRKNAIAAVSCPSESFLSSGWAIMGHGLWNVTHEQLGINERDITSHWPCFLHLPATEHSQAPGGRIRSDAAKARRANRKSGASASPAAGTDGPNSSTQA